jgi:predicted O-methyltransferase YrrM
MKKALKQLLPFIDFFLSPIVLASAFVFKIISKIGLRKFSLTRGIFNLTGIYPVRDHYYEPLINPKHLYKSLSDERVLPGINWNEENQITLLNAFNFQKELLSIPIDYVSETEFNYNNGSFESGDAEYLYSIIRLKKPQKIIEIGSGHSTKMAKLAIIKNSSIDNNYTCKHICIEPFEMPWLEKIGVEVIRKKVEHIDISFFSQLEMNDILFIDSSHMIRPQGDVLFEFLEILPTLKKGVIVHIHDIFSPRDYLEEWVVKENKFWNEQYLLEAFLSCNNQWEIIGAVNYLKHRHYDLLKDKLPLLTESREPGSFYIVKK